MTLLQWCARNRLAAFLLLFMIGCLMRSIAETLIGDDERTYWFDGGPVPQEYNLKGSPYYLPKPGAWRKRKVVFDAIEGMPGSWPRPARNRKRMAAFEPVIHCTDEDRVGRMGDGAKWCCHLGALGQRRGRRPCVVYSFGSNGDTSFEEDLYFITNGSCEVHTFDPEPSYARLWEGAPRGLYYHAMAVNHERSLRQIASALGHLTNGIDVLKIDIEGGEYQVLHEALTAGLSIGQLLVEVHEMYRSHARRTFELVKLLERHGLYQFHAEVNPYNSRACRELSFLNVTYQFH